MKSELVKRKLGKRTAVFLMLVVVLIVTDHGCLGWYSFCNATAAGSIDSQRLLIYHIFCKWIEDA